MSRKLTASGYSIGQRLKLRGVDATCLKDSRGMSMILVSNIFYGPSWAQIFKSFAHLVPAPSLVTLANTPAVLIDDSTINREILGSLFSEAKASRVKQVHLEGVGFVELDAKAKLDLKLLVLPLVSVVCAVALGIFWGNSNQPRGQSVDVEPIGEVCVVDKNRPEFEAWLLDSLGAETGLISGKKIQKTTAMGKLEIVVESTIGSAAKVTGLAVCGDGRQRAINHRVDTSGSGVVLELGQ